MPKKILIIDDSATIRQQLRAFLEGHGYAVTDGDNGTAGLAKAGADTFDLVIVDVNMPGISGLEVIERLRKLPAYTKTPVFVLTTEATPAIMAQGKQVGATAWIVKPFKPEVLLKGVQKVLST